jgi:4-amino-4-deoxy-L-arabinose transferase-like glycosyltransferase
MPNPACPSRDRSRAACDRAGNGDAVRRGKSLRALLFVLLIAFIVRAGVFALVASQADATVYRSPDSERYVKLAEALDETGDFAIGQQPEIARTPGYPLFLAGSKRAGELDVTAACFQILLSCATVALVYAIGRQFAGSAAGLAAAVLYTFSPLSILYVNRLLTETLFTFLVAAFVATLVRHLRSGGWCSLLVSAISLSASVYVRPIAYFLPPLAGLALLVRGVVRSGHRGRRLAQAVAFLVLALGTVAVWQVRNHERTGYAGFSSIADSNLYFYQAAAIRARQQGKPYYDVQKEMGYLDDLRYFQQHPEQVDWTTAERHAYLRREGFRAILRSPGAYAVVHLKGMARVLLDPGSIEVLKLFRLYPSSGGELLGQVVDKGAVAAMRALRTERPVAFWTTVVLGVWLAAVLLAACIGLLPRRDVPWPLILTLVLIAGYFWVLSGGPHSEGRFRHPMMPLICVLAGLALTRGNRRKEESAAAERSGQ